MTGERKPPVAAPSREPRSAHFPVPVPESKDERLTVRMTPSDRARWEDGARRRGEEVSRYFRKCADIGRRVIESGMFHEATGA